MKCPEDMCNMTGFTLSLLYFYYNLFRGFDFNLTIEGASKQGFSHCWNSDSRLREMQLLRLAASFPPHPLPLFSSPPSIPLCPSLLHSLIRLVHCIIPQTHTAPHCPRIKNSRASPNPKLEKGIFMR